MSTLTLVRFASSDEGVRGVLTLPSMQTFCTLELPWRDNKRTSSCIPEGSYPCIWSESPRFGFCYHVTQVKNRSDILIHNGNYAGDEAKGYKTDSSGCILVGKSHGIILGQRAVLASLVSRALFEAVMSTKPFILEITQE